MTIASYSDLQTKVANFLHRGNLTSIIPDLILLGEKRIARDVRSSEMETSYSGTIAAGVVAVPTDFLGWRSVYVETTPIQTLQAKPLEWLWNKYPTRSADSIPLFIARNGANFEFGPYPDSTYAVKGTYYKRPTAVSSSWNALATANPDLYLMAALCEAEPYLKNDKRVMLWESKYKGIVDAINKEATEADFSGAPMMMTRG